MADILDTAPALWPAIIKAMASLTDFIGSVCMRACALSVQSALPVERWCCLNKNTRSVNFHQSGGCPWSTVCLH